MKRFDFFRGNDNSQDKFYWKIGLCIFVVAAALILFEKVIGHLPAISSGISTALHYFNTLVSPFLMGFAIAYVLNPFMRFFERLGQKHIGYLRRHPRTARAAAILLNYLIVIGGSVWIVIYLLPEIKNSVMTFTANLTVYSETMNLRIQNLFDQIPYIDSENVNNVLNRFMQPLTEASQDIPAILETIAGNIYVFGRVTLNFVMALFISFYMLFDKENFGKQIRKIVYALSNEAAAARFFVNANRVHHIFQDFIVGKAVDSLIIGILAFIGLSLMDAPFPLILSLIIGVTNMIPYFGPFIGAIPAIFITLLIDPPLAVWVALFILILQQFDGNFLGPKILGNSLDLSPLWIILAVVVGGATMGPVGMFIGVPVLATFKTFGGEYISRRYARKYADHDPLATEAEAAPAKADEAP